ncbi:MAG TPA: hypothetical protein VKE24_02220 [Candidatus Acidoferrales bacterium]|nr:hypothetical protein [Candidatus Acidoferrales bacterium]
MKRFLALLLGLSLALSLGVAAPQGSPRLPSNPPAVKAPSAEFLNTADEVLTEMSKLLSLPVLVPLKKSVRTREEIREYIIRRMKADKEPQKRYADQKALEKFGFVPKGFGVEAFLVELLTEQIAGLYDPKAQEFFIADWISPADQRVVMAHELTHALQDQHFQVDPWMDAAKPNDDAELARDAVLEGSATAAMVDYLLRGQAHGIRDMGELDVSQFLGELDKSPELAKAPLYIRDELLFPYVAGTTFTQRFLRANSGWADFHKVFEKPPVSTQQILHPDLYLKGLAPKQVTLPDLARLMRSGWRELDQNVLGEFGFEELLKQFLGRQRATRLAPAWVGDRYAVFEQQKTKQVLLVFLLQLASEADAARVCGSYSEALELKYANRRDLFRRPNFFSFDTDEGGVFLRCVGDQCLTVEGANRDLFDRVTRALGWPAGPAAPAKPLRPAEKTSVTALLPVAASSAAR